MNLKRAVSTNLNLAHNDIGGLTVYDWADIVESVLDEVQVRALINELQQRYDFKRKNLTDSEILDKNTSIRGIMKPLTLKENIDILEHIGFKKIDIFFKKMNFVGIIAIK